MEMIHISKAEFDRIGTEHIWSVWKPASATLRCLTATQSTRRGLDPPAGRMEVTPA